MVDAIAHTLKLGIMELVEYGWVATDNHCHACHAY